MTVSLTQPTVLGAVDVLPQDDRNGIAPSHDAEWVEPQRPPPAIPPFPVLRFSVEEYHRMAEAGFLAESDRVELLDGWLVPKMTHKPRHDGTIQLIDETVRPLLPQIWRIRIQCAVSTLESEPEPDLALVKGPLRAYLARHPSPADIGLLIEVAESSLSEDRYKCGIYARAQIPVYWLVNLPRNQIEVYSEPSGPADEPAYAKRTDYQAGDEVPLVLDGQEIARIAVADLLP